MKKFILYTLMLASLPIAQIQGAAAPVSEVSSVFNWGNAAKAAPFVWYALKVAVENNPEVVGSLFGNQSAEICKNLGFGAPASLPWYKQGFKWLKSGDKFMTGMFMKMQMYNQYFRMGKSLINWMSSKETQESDDENEEMTVAQRRAAYQQQMHAQQMHAQQQAQARAQQAQQAQAAGQRHVQFAPTTSQNTPMHHNAQRAHLPAQTVRQASVPTTTTRVASTAAQRNRSGVTNQVAPLNKKAQGQLPMRGQRADGRSTISCRRSAC